MAGDQIDKKAFRCEKRQKMTYIQNNSQILKEV